MPTRSSGDQPSVTDHARVDVEDNSIRVGHNEKVLGKLPYAVSFLGLCLDALRQCFVQVAQLVLAGGEVGFGTLSCGNFLGGDIDPDDVPARVFRRMPVCDQDAIYIRPVGPLTVDLDAGDGFARTQDRLHNLLYLVSDLRNRLPDRPSDMVSNRNAANFRQVLIDHHVATIGVEKARPIGAVRYIQFQVR